jgi:PTH1 family peptidyl-tRNA hydrolase
MASLALRMIVGLGNPGAEYARTRHNAGFWLVDELARRHGGAWRNDSRHTCELARVQVGSQDLWLVKPMSFMNRSGTPVAGLANFHKIAPTEILVGHDELDLPPGVLRLKESGGHGGHNGVRDVIAHLGQEFWRMRIGIGHPGNKAQVLEYALGRPSAADQELLQRAVQDAADAIPLLLEQGAQKVMNQLHTRGVPPA